MPELAVAPVLKSGLPTCFWGSGSHEIVWVRLLGEVTIRYCGTMNMTPGSSRVVMSSVNRAVLSGKSMRAKAYADNEAVQRLMNAANWEVRRTAAYLLRQIQAGAEAQ